MPSRAAHHKSRSGCLNCKRRRIKCNEQRPTCAGCQCRGDSCSYATTRAPATPGREVSSDISRRGEERQDESQPLEQNAEDATGLVELELWHQWTCDTYQSFVVDDGKDEDTWKVLVPSLALKYNFLRFSLLAISSLHLAHDRPPDPPRSRHLINAVKYQTCASQAYRTHQAHERTTIAFEPSYAFSLINVALTLGMLRHGQFVRDDEGNILDEIKTLFALLRGVVAVIFSDQLGARQEVFAINVAFFVDSPVRELDPSTAEALERLRFMSSGSKAIETSPFSRNIYGGAVFWLEESFRRCREGDTSVVMMWPLKLDSVFLQAVESADPIALLILLHWAVLLHDMGRAKWWARGAGVTVVAEVLSMIPQGDGAWKESIEWVCRRTGLKEE